jgi:hypothetical protein
MTTEFARVADTTRGGALALPASAFRLLCLFLLLWFASERASAASDAAAGNPRLSHLQIEIWPEYDRRGAALVILRGEIAPDAALPAAVRLRIPATSGGPTAVAYSAEQGGNLLNLKYDRSDSGAFVTLHFQAPGRRFQVEFYDPLATNDTRRSYAYAWSGDFAVERIDVVVQEPAASSEFAVRPSLGAPAAGQDGLQYRSAILGSTRPGEPLELAVDYSKTDARTSAEILGAKPSETSPLPATGKGGKERVPWIVAGVLALLALGAVAWWWTLRRRLVPPSAVAARICAKCRTPSTPADRFCSNCGAPLTASEKR